MRAKLIAVVGPTLALVALPIVWAGVHAPLAALLMALPVVMATCAAALISLWGAVPGSRDDFKQRGKGRALTTSLELLSTISWAVTAYLLNRVLVQAEHDRYSMLGLAGAMLAALLILAAAWRWRYHAAHEARTLDVAK